MHKKSVEMEDNFQEIVATYENRMDKFAANVASDGKRIKSLKEALSRNEMTILVSPEEAQSLSKLCNKARRCKWNPRKPLLFALIHPC